MARLGIVIAVSENEPPVTSLAACANDAEAIAAVLGEAKRFDEVLVLSTKSETKSVNLKSSLADFFKKYQGISVEELVFYYSGHGDFEGSEFYFILSDYTSGAKHRTSLTNSELDTMVRGLGPGLFVKIVDACYSGMSYVKSDGVLDDYLKGTQAGFQHLYFLYSSRSNETSSTKGALSAFTTSILEEVAARSTGKVRYRDLMNAASDYFEANGGQTPHFVTQAPYTETFCDASPAMQAVVAKYLPTPTSGSYRAPNPSAPVQPPAKSLTIVERIAEADNAYCSRDEAVGALELFLNRLAESTLVRELPILFDLSNVRSEEEPAGVRAIGEWLQGHADRGFFAKPAFRTETYKRRVPKAQPSLLNLNRNFVSRLMPNYMDSLPEAETKLIDAKRIVVTGYQNTASLPFASATLALKPKYKLLTPEECVAVPIVSSTHVRIFWMFRRYKRTDWENVEPSGIATEWSSTEVALRDQDAITGVAKRIGKELNDFVMKGLHANWPEPVPTLALKAKGAPVRSGGTAEES